MARGKCGNSHLTRFAMKCCSIDGGSVAVMKIKKDVNQFKYHYMEEHRALHVELETRTPKLQQQWSRKGVLVAQKKQPTHGVRSTNYS